MVESRFTASAAEAIRNAWKTSAELGHSYVGSEHLLLGLAEQKTSQAAFALSCAGVDGGLLRQAMALQVGVGVRGRTVRRTLTPNCCSAIRTAAEESRRLGGKRVDPEHLLLGIAAGEECGGAKLLEACGADRRKLYRSLSASLGGEERGQVRDREPEVRTVTDTRTLDQCSRDLTRMGAEGRLDPVIGRDGELERVIRILSRRTKNNPVLIGEPGVGKTAVAEGLALAIGERTAPVHLLDKRVCALDLAAMVAGTKYRGEFEDKLRRVLEEVKRAGNVILFIDELHTIMGAGSAEGAIDAANILKPALARGEVQVMGATTPEEYRRHIEKDAALERRFQPVDIREPDREGTLEILRGLRSRYESYHSLVITDRAMEAAVDLSVRYLPQRFLPDKAIDLVDEAASRVRLSHRNTELQQLQKRALEAGRSVILAVRDRDFERAARFRDAEQDFRRQLREESLRRTEGKQVEEEDIRAVLGQWTGVPVTDPEQADRAALKDLEHKLKQGVVGQDRAVEAVAGAIRRSRLGLRDPDRPVGCFLFLGPSGVGKTQLCRKLAECLFGDEKALLRFDMTEYREAHSLSRLIGAPPGYVGHEDGGQLTEQVRRKPWSVVLLDEFEKAHRDVWSVLLQVMEEGVLTDGQGRRTDFRNTVVILTSNLGAGRFAQGSRLGFRTGGEPEQEQQAKEVLTDVKRTFAPEFLNRLDGIQVFRPLDRESLRTITRKLLEDSGRRLDRLGITLEAGETAVDLLAGRGSGLYGARPLRRAVAELVEDPAADLMLDGKLERGDTLALTVENGRLRAEAKKTVMS